MPYSTASRMCPTSVDDNKEAFVDDADIVDSPDYSTVPLDLSSSPVLDPTYYRTVRNRTSSAGSGSDCSAHLSQLISGSGARGGSGPSLWWDQQQKHHFSFMPDFFDVGVASLVGGVQLPVTAKIMSRVVDNQREKFETDQYFRRLSRESEVRYAGVAIERPLEQRRRQFEQDVNNGFLIVSFLTSGIHMMLTFRNPRNVPEAPTGHDRDLSVAEIRNTQLFLQSKMIVNGVCVIWTGYMDMETLDGLGRLDFDAAAAEAEAARTQQAANVQRR